MDRSVTQACRAVPSGDENARKCCLSVPRCTLERQKGAELLLKRAALHSRATKSMGFVAEESPPYSYVILPYTHGQPKWTEVLPESVVLHSRATKMLGSVTQACRVALSGDDIGLKCCLRWGVGSHRSTSPLGRAVELHRWDTPWNGTGAGDTGYTMLRAVKRRR